ncbi:MAG: ribbon-helix-helix domain-containing protein [Actinobacteria bacterium]|nr:ribbon-helix-helix domain-containing protein [Actinomycetota bacterium]MCL5444691.1 ribbon-helix-helix domain-containing protein [Actinomycetota bacterium]
MTKQLTVRLAEDLVEFIDERVQQGKAPSRAAVVAAAIDRERRREIAERDAEILARSTSHDDLDDLAAFAAHNPLDNLA